MVVKVPRRPRDIDAGRDRRQSEALREQALIEEARERAQRRRRRNVAVVMLALAAGAALGLGPAVADQVGQRLAATPDPAPGAHLGVRNGEIAVAGAVGGLQVVNADGSGLRTSCGMARDSSGWVGCLISEPAWSPDGKRLAFVRGRIPNPLVARPAMSVFVARDGAPAKALAACGSCGALESGLDWSPDGAQLGFSRDAPGGSTYPSLWVVDSRSGELRQLTDCESGCSDVDPDWSPNGDLIIFSRIGWRGSFLYTVRPDGSDLTRLPTPGGGHPVWSPDGRRIAFEGGETLYVAAADGSHAMPIVDGARGSGPGIPAWSPDGTRLAFIYAPGVRGAFKAELWMINADGTHERVVAAPACCGAARGDSVATRPAWSPDGTQIAFATNFAGGTYVVNANGSGLHQITRSYARALSWRPAH